MPSFFEKLSSRFRRSKKPLEEPKVEETVAVPESYTGLESPGVVAPAAAPSEGERNAKEDGAGETQTSELVPVSAVELTEPASGHDDVDKVDEEKEAADADKLRGRYTRFRILVIGRANAGKTTLLKRVCNTDEEPCIYDENNQSLIEPTEDKGIHDINRPFSFKSNPGFIFHDSPGFEAGGEKELKAVQTFIEERSKATKVDEQLHAIWFCFIPDVSRPLLGLEQQFFNEHGQGNVPVVALFTKFDDLLSQVWDIGRSLDDNIAHAKKTLEEKFEKTLRAYKFPPRAYVRFNDLHDDEGNHQEQVKTLIDQTAASLDVTALRKLFVSVQTNNLEICIKYAIEGISESEMQSQNRMTTEVLSWFPHAVYNDVIYDAANEMIIRRTLETMAEGLVPVLFASPDSQPGVGDVAGLCIAVEGSFWIRDKKAQDTSSDVAEVVRRVQAALELYRSTGCEDRVQQAIAATIDGDPWSKENKGHLITIVLDNLLPHPK